MSDLVTVDAVINLAGRLSTLDKVRLIEWLAPQIAQDLQAGATEPRKSLRGLWLGQATNGEEVDQVRKDLWRNFPRQDV